METCIVCLGDLPDRDPIPPVDDGGTNPDRVVLTMDDLAESVIARLPCSHMLHNSCLSMWALRSNSCPICRRPFNLVQLAMSWTGPVVSDYEVKDVVQRVDEEEEPVLDEEVEPEGDLVPCLACSRHVDEDALLICDHCGSPYHTYCLDHDVDSDAWNSWTCAGCLTDFQQQGPGDGLRQAHHRPQASLTPPTRTARREIRERRRHLQQQEISAANRDARWRRAWRDVWDRLEPEAPEDEEEPRDFNERTEREKIELEEWKRRLEVSRRMPNSKFAETAGWLLNGRRAPEVAEPAMSKEEQTAWDMMEQAEKMGDVTGSRGRKKRSQSASSTTPDASPKKQKLPQTRRISRSELGSPVRPPKRKASETSEAGDSSSKRAKVEQSSFSPEDTPKVEQTSSPPPEETEDAPIVERKQKRPQTRRIVPKTEPGEAGDIGYALRASVNAQTTMAFKSESAGSPEAHSPDGAMSSSLLDSLLENINRPQPESSLDAGLLHHLHQYGSTAFDTSVITPAPSPPRMASPVLLTERERQRNSISQANRNVSPHRTPRQSPTLLPHRGGINAMRPSITVPPNRQQSPPPLHLSHSPITAGMASPPVPPALIPATKTEIEKMVRAALKPHYVPGGISKDEFANINKKVSRKLYAMVDDSGRIKEWEKARWEKTATEEVQVLVDELPAKRASLASQA